MFAAVRAVPSVTTAGSVSAEGPVRGAGLLEHLGHRVAHGLGRRGLRRLDPHALRRERAPVEVDRRPLDAAASDVDAEPVSHGCAVPGPGPCRTCQPECRCRAAPSEWTVPAVRGRPLEQGRQRRLRDRGCGLLDRRERGLLGGQQGPQRVEVAVHPRAGGRAVRRQHLEGLVDRAPSREPQGEASQLVALAVLHSRERAVPGAAPQQNALLRPGSA